MISRRNSKTLKVISTSIVAPLAIGNYSTVWMVKKSTAENSRKQKIVETIAKRIVN